MRRAIFWMAAEKLLQLVGSKPGRWLLPQAEGLPPDAKLLEVHFDWQRRVFGFVVESETFKAVPEGQEIPWCGRLQMQWCELEGHPSGLVGISGPTAGAALRMIAAVVSPTAEPALDAAEFRHYVEKHQLPTTDPAPVKFREFL